MRIFFYLMCTYLQSRQLNFTFKPIIVYKVLLITPAGEYNTPVVKSHIKLKKTYKAEGYCEITSTQDRYKVTKGIIHSFATKATCREYSANVDNAVIAKCKIPRFTFYALGKSIYKEKEAYVSKRLKYLQIV